MASPAGRAQILFAAGPDFFRGGARFFRGRGRFFCGRARFFCGGARFFSRRGQFFFEKFRIFFGRIVGTPQPPAQKGVAPPDPFFGRGDFFRKNSRFFRQSARFFRKSARFFSKNGRIFLPAGPDFLRAGLDFSAGVSDFPGRAGSPLRLEKLPASQVRAPCRWEIQIMMQKYAQRTLKPEGRAAHAIAARNACPTNKKFLATLHNFFQHDNFFKFLKFSKFSGSIFFTSQIIHRKAPCLRKIGYIV